MLFAGLLMMACSPSDSFSEENLMKLAKKNVKAVFSDYSHEVKFQKIQEIEYFERNVTGYSDYIKDRACGIAVLKSKTTKELEYVKFSAYFVYSSCGFKNCPGAVIRFVPISKSSIKLSEEEIAKNKRNIDFLCQNHPNGVSVIDGLF